MSNEFDTMDNTQLDAALDRLRPPQPSDTLVARVRGMTPIPKPDRLMPRRAVAAMLALAIGAATLLQMNTDPTDTTPGAKPAQPVAAIADPAGEIPVSDLALADDAVSAPTEPFSIAGMPLE
jgi:hypothetical protein